MPPALPPPEPHLYVRDPPIYKHIVSSESEKSRIYVLDWLILAYLLRNKWATSQQLSEHFNRSRRTINKHLRKLERLHLVERHGRTRCCFQWYSIPRENEPAVAEIVRKLRRDFVSGRTYVVFTVLKNQASLKMLSPSCKCASFSAPQAKRICGGSSFRLDSVQTPTGIQRVMSVSRQASVSVNVCCPHPPHLG